MIEYKVVCFGEILWDVLPTGTKPGGAPMNVAYHLQKLDMRPALISRVGKDEKGVALTDLLQHQGISTKYIQVDEQHPTGIVTATIKENNEVEYDIVAPVAWDFITWSDHFISLIDQAEYLVFGSLAARSPQSRETLFQLIERAKTKVLDINLRPPHFNQSLVEQLLHKADLLKLNENELPLIAGWYGQHTDPVDQLKLLQDKFSISVIVVTRGGEGALLIKEGSVATHKGYKVTVSDTVGSGDAFLAALLSRLDSKATAEEALAFANGLGAFVATYSGACPDYSLEQVHELVNRHTS